MTPPHKYADQQAAAALVEALEDLVATLERYLIRWQGARWMIEQRAKWIASRGGELCAGTLTVLIPKRGGKTAALEVEVAEGESDQSVAARTARAVNKIRGQL